MFISKTPCYEEVNHIKHGRTLSFFSWYSSTNITRKKKEQNECPSKWTFHFSKHFTFCKGNVLFSNLPSIYTIDFTLLFYVLEWALICPSWSYGMPFDLMGSLHSLEMQHAHSTICQKWIKLFLICRESQIIKSSI